MRKIWALTKREYLATVRTRGFLIGLLLGPLLMGGGALAVWLLKDQVDTRDKRIAVVDHSGKLFEALRQAAKARNTREVYDPTSGKKLRPAYLFESVVASATGQEDFRLTLSDRVRRGELHGFLEIGSNVLHPGTNQSEAQLAYYANNSAMDDLRRWMPGPLNDELRRLRLAEAGIHAAQVPDLFDWRAIEGMELVRRETQGGQTTVARRSSELRAVGLPLIVAVLAYLLAMMGAMPLLSAVMEEKNQRIAEVLLGCARPFEIMLGKLLGGAGVALTGSILYVGGALFILTSLHAVEHMPLVLIPWFLVFTLLNILMCGAVFAALGAACTDAKDAQSLTLPAMMPLLIPMFLLGPLLKEPHSTFAVAASLFPPFTPLLMLFRMSTPAGVPAWQPWIGLLGVMLFTVLTIWAGGRIFRVGLLLQARVPRLRELLRWALRG